MNEGLVTRYLVKFRAWDISTKELLTWTMFDDYPFKGKEATCPQCNTGFFDKNKKEIFIGDIVSYKDENYLVSNNSGSFVFKPLFKTDMPFFWFPDLVDFQHELAIIGNTFNNADYIQQNI